MFMVKDIKKLNSNDKNVADYDSYSYAEVNDMRAKSVAVLKKIREEIRTQDIKK